MSPPEAMHGEALREAAEGVHYALLALGHDSVLTLTDRLCVDERRNIALGPNFFADRGLNPPPKTVLYNLEQICDGSPWTTPALFDLFKRYPVWDYSQANIERLAERQIPRPTHVPIGYVPELTRIVPAPEDIDVLFYGSLNERRLAVLHNLHSRGLRVESLRRHNGGLYGATRDAWIARSKIVLNMHYFETKVFEIVRVSYLLANKRAVVSERGADPKEEQDLEPGIAFAEYDELVDRCVDLIANEPARRELAERGFQAFSARNQADILRRVLPPILD